MEIFLTKLDRDIEKSIQRDPLKQQVIWRYLANQLYSNINSVTNDIKGFIIADLWQEILCKLKVKKVDQASEIKKRYVSYENIIIYSLVEETKNKELSFIGKEKGIEIFNKTASNPYISKNILVRQEYLGYVGRYNTKIIKIRSKNLSNTFSKIAFENNLEEIINFFVEILNKDLKNLENLKFKNIFNDKREKIKNMIINGLLSYNNEKNNKFLEVLEIIDKDDISNQGKNFIFECIKNDDEKNTREIVEEIIGKKSFDENLRQKLINIRVTEQVLLTLNNLFYLILNKKNIDEMLEAINKETEKETEIKKLQRVIREYNEKIFRIQENYKLNKQYKNVFDKINSDSKEILKALLEDHKILQEKANKKSWIEIDSNDNIKINHYVNEQLNGEWIHDYYIGTIKNLLNSMNYIK